MLSISVAILLIGLAMVVFALYLRFSTLDDPRHLDTFDKSVRHDQHNSSRNTSKSSKSKSPNKCGHTDGGTNNNKATANKNKNTEPSSSSASSSYFSSNNSSDSQFLPESAPPPNRVKFSRQPSSLIRTLNELQVEDQNCVGPVDIDHPDAVYRGPSSKRDSRAAQGICDSPSEKISDDRSASPIHMIFNNGSNSSDDDSDDATTCHSSDDASTVLSLANSMSNDDNISLHSSSSSLPDHERRRRQRRTRTTVHSEYDVEAAWLEFQQSQSELDDPEHRTDIATSQYPVLARRPAQAKSKRKAEPVRYEV